MKLYSDNSMTWVVLILVLLYGCKTREQVHTTCHRAEGCWVTKHLSD